LKLEAEGREIPNVWGNLNKISGAGQNNFWNRIECSLEIEELEFKLEKKQLGFRNMQKSLKI
jgi:hypothetical protein